MVMADPRAIAQVSLNRDTNLPVDITVNTWHFEGDQHPTNSDRDHWDDLAPGLSSRLVTFYQAIQTNLASSLNGTGRVKLYDFSDAEPRIPRFEQAFTFTPGGSSLPAEVALCLSMRAADVAGANPRRRRGRIFLGPINSSAGSEFTTGWSDLRPSVGMRQAILNAAATLALGGVGTFRLSVFSPTTLVSGTVDEAWNDVEHMWIDDAWDTIRSRGGAPTSRVTHTIVG